MRNNIFDTHAHYTDKRFGPDRDAFLCSLPGRGVARVIACGSDVPDSRKTLALAEKHGYIYAACGIHPHETSRAGLDWLAELTNLLQHEKCVALGEIGLDYHYDFSPRDTQRECFTRQLQLARELDLPVIVHDREAHEDTLKLLQEYKPKGVVHCFSGSRELAREVCALGIYIGLGGAVTFKNARKSCEVAAEIPLERLLLETDAPYMAPEPHRGERCDSAHIAYVAEKIAGLRGMEPQELIDQCHENACKLFGI